MSQSPQPVGGFDLDKTSGTVGDYLRARVFAIRTGEVGSAPIIIGLIAIALIFRFLSPNYLTPFNVVNMMLQAGGIATIGIGVVFILLIAEIDLSIAFNSAVAGVLMTLLLRPDGTNWPWWVAIPIALAVSTLISLLMGVIVTRAGVPSFVVTLAGNLALSGVVLILTTQFSTAGTIRLQDSVAIGIAGYFLPALWSWLLLAATVIGFGFMQFRNVQVRRSRGLSSTPLAIILTQLALLAIVGGVVVWYSNTDRGVPLLAVIVGVFLIFWSFVLNRTRFGRHVLAIGGNPEAARRAGIAVVRVRLAVFMVAGFMAGFGGIVLASRLRSVSPNQGGGSLLLDVIAAAVIGGTSLFGGRGKVSSALLGALVIALINNGMDGLGLNSGIKFVITGMVLLGAVLLDALSSRKARQSGR